MTLWATDLAGNKADQSFTIQVQDQNLPPVAHPQTVRAATATSKTIQLTGDDGNSGVQTLSYAIVKQPDSGTLSGFDPATGAVTTDTVTYTSFNGHTGPDSFTFTVTDDTSIGGQAALTSAPATVSINVLPPNNPPTAAVQSVSTSEDAPLAITLTGTDGNPGLNQTLTYSIFTQPSHGTLSGFDPATGAVTYTPDPAYNGPDSFTFRTKDDDKAEPPNLQSGPAMVSITVSPVNRPPIAYSQSFTTNESTSKSIVLAGNGNDPEVSQVLTFAPGTMPSHGTLSGFDAATGARDLHPGAGLFGSGQLHVHRERRCPGGPSAQLDQPGRHGEYPGQSR